MLPIRDEPRPCGACGELVLSCVHWKPLLHGKMARSGAEYRRRRRIRESGDLLAIAELMRADEKVIWDAHFKAKYQRGVDTVSTHTVE